MAFTEQSHLPDQFSGFHGGEFQGLGAVALQFDAEATAFDQHHRIGAVTLPNHQFTLLDGELLRIQLLLMGLHQVTQPLANGLELTVDTGHHAWSWAAFRWLILSGRGCGSLPAS